MKNTLSLEAAFMKNHSVTGSGFYAGLNDMLLVQWWVSERRSLVCLGPGKHKRKAKSSAAEISTSNFFKNCKSCVKNFFAWAGHAMLMTSPVIASIQNRDK